MRKPILAIAAALRKNNPWTQDPTNEKFFFIKLTSAWGQNSRYYEKNPKTGQPQQLAIDPDFINKRVRGEPIAEDAIGLSADRLTLWRFSSDTTPTMSSYDMEYDETDERFDPAAYNDPWTKQVLERWVGGYGQERVDAILIKVALVNGSPTLFFANGKTMNPDQSWSMNWGEQEKFAGL
jgi:hypothetical protein